MAMSGVEVDTQCKTVYDDVQAGKKHRYVTFKIDNGKIRVDQIGERNATYDQFLEALKQKDGDNEDCRYAIYDFEYVVESQGTEASFRTKVLLVLWCPDMAKIKKKMVYSASFDSLKKAFKGALQVIQANGEDEIEEASVKKLLIGQART